MLQSPNPSSAYTGTGPPMTTCVCSHEAADHHAWTGPCHNACGCSYMQPDNGIEPTEITPSYRPYDGFYARKQWTA